MKRLVAVCLLLTVLAFPVLAFEQAEIIEELETLAEVWAVRAALGVLLNELIILLEAVRSEVAADSPTLVLQINLTLKIIENCKRIIQIL